VVEGGVYAVLQPDVQREGGMGGTGFAISVKDADNFRAIGRSRDFCRCAQIKSNGEQCRNHIDARKDKLCQWHQDQLFSKALKSDRMNLNNAGLSCIRQGYQRLDDQRPKGFKGQSVTTHVGQARDFRPGMLHGERNLSHGQSGVYVQEGQTVAGFQSDDGRAAAKRARILSKEELLQENEKIKRKVEDGTLRGFNRGALMAEQQQKNAEAKVRIEREGRILRQQKKAEEAARAKAFKSGTLRPSTGLRAARPEAAGRAVRAPTAPAGSNSAIDKLYTRLGSHGQGAAEGFGCGGNHGSGMMGVRALAGRAAGRDPRGQGARLAGAAPSMSYVGAR
jgi:hypothetical protein